MTARAPSTTQSSRALFIVLEGIDGSGTTTQLDRLVDYLRRRGRSALATREPSTGPIGVLLREILLGRHAAGDGAPVDGRAMALLFAADRRDHLAREIEPALAAGTDVVSDRYVLSSLAYQQVEADRVWVESLAEGIRLPDLTVLLDIGVEVAAGRRRQAGRPTERYDGDQTLNRVAQNYQLLAKQPDAPAHERGAGGRWGRVVTVDASKSIDEVAVAVAVEAGRLVDRAGRNEVGQT